MSSWDRIRVQGPNARQAIVAGVIATVVVTVLMYVGAAFGIAVWNIPSMIAGVISFNKNITTNNALWVWGIVLYAIFCVLISPLIYAYWLYSYLPGPNWLRGLIWGAFLWFIVEMLFMPLIGQGLFDSNGRNIPTEIISQLVLWLAYGVVLGFIAGIQEVWRPRHQERAA